MLLNAVIMAILVATVMYSSQIEKKKMDDETWRSFLQKFKEQLKWIEFSATRYCERNKCCCEDKNNCNCGRKKCNECDILNDVFNQSKLYIGKEKDNFLIRLDKDVDVVKKEVKKMLCDSGSDDQLLDFTQNNIQEYQRIECVISWFCEKHSNKNLEQFSKDSWVNDIIKLETTFSYLERKHSRSPITCTVFILTYLPTIVSILSVLYSVVSLFILPK